MEKEIQNLLNSLAVLQSGIEEIRESEQTAIDSVLTPEIQQQVSDIRDEFAEKADMAHKAITETEKKIKEMVIDYGVSVKGKFLMAVFNKGRVKFDTKRAQAYLKSQGVYDEYCTEGNPYASIRKV